MFAWRFLDSDGEELGSSEQFGDQAQAESWMGESWGGLRERGVDEVMLVAVDSGETLYRMALADESS